MLNIRIATPSDEAFLKASIEAAYHEYPRLIARGESTLERAVDAVFDGIGEGFAHVASLDGRDVGSAWWTPDGGSDQLGVAYHVAPEARNQGIATHLLEAGLGEARRRGLRAVTIKTHPENAASIALARKLGFQPVVALFRHDL